MKPSQSPERKKAMQMKDAGNFKDAENLLLRLLLRHPEDIQILVDTAILYHDTGRLHAAQSCYERAYLLAPDNAGICTNFGNLLYDMDEEERCIRISEDAVKQIPDHPSMQKNLANKYRDFKHFDKALHHYKEYLKLKDDPAVDFDLGFTALYARNDLDYAWEHFEKRFQTKYYQKAPDFPLPQWDGKSSLKDKKLLLVAEQGYGDTILMTRFLPALKEKCADITLLCDKTLHGLFSDLSVTLEDNVTDTLNEYDYYIYMMSLPPIFEKDWLQWPAPPTLSYKNNPGANEKFNWIDDFSKKRLKVGIVWSGNPAFSNNEKRSLPLDWFLRLAAEHPNIQFFSFQKGPPEKEFVTTGMATIRRLGHMFDDFTDTTVAMEHMDLMVMTDSAVAHLAGSIGKPVLNLLHYRPYWIYFPETPTAPIYPSMRLIRQNIPGNWASVYDETSAILGDLSKQKARTPKSILKTIDNNIDKNIDKHLVAPK